MTQEKLSGERPSPDPAPQRHKRPYEAPRILSDEPLEVAAALCTGTGGFGKSGPPKCGRLGS